MKKIFLLFILFMFFLSTSISSKAYATLPLTFDSINTGTIRDQDDDGNPDFIDWTGGTIIEVDERIISDTWSLARRGVIEFEIDDSIRDIKISSAQIDLFQTGWPNGPVEWYIATDDDGIIGINDWYNTGALDSGTIIRSTSGIDTIDITVALQSLIENNADYFRIGLKMVDPDVSHALFYGQDATDNPILRVEPDIDNDGDGYTENQGDCDDNDPSIYPGAPETKHDGIDQDCNGYDLTIDITKADYSSKNDNLKVEATSDLGQGASLELVSYGLMKWMWKKAVWKISVSGAGGDPGTVTVCGIEGCDSVATNASGGGGKGGKEGKGRTCSDGLDNDSDGSIDCDDSDCSGNRSCR